MTLRNIIINFFTPVFLLLVWPHGEATAQDLTEIVIKSPVLAIWKDEGGPVALDVPGAKLFCSTGVELTEPHGQRRFCLEDKNQILLKTIISQATGIEETFYVSTIIPGLIIGMKNFEGQDVRADLILLTDTAGH